MTMESETCASVWDALAGSPALCYSIHILLDSTRKPQSM